MSVQYGFNIQVIDKVLYKTYLYLPIEIFMATGNIRQERMNEHTFERSILNNTLVKSLNSITNTHYTGLVNLKLTLLIYGSLGQASVFKFVF